MGIILPDVCKSRLFTLDVSELYPSLLPFVHPWLVPSSHVVESIETFHRTEGYTAGVMMFKWFDQVLMHQIITDFQEFRKIWCTESHTPRDSVDRKNLKSSWDILHIKQGMISLQWLIRVVNWQALLKLPNSCSSLGSETLPWPKINLLGLSLYILFQ